MKNSTKNKQINKIHCQEVLATVDKNNTSQKIKTKNKLKRLSLEEKLYFQLLAQDVIRSFLPKVSDSNKTIWVMREVASHLSVEDVKNLSKVMGEKEGVENKLDAAEDFFRQNNIFIPKTEEEMDRMLKRYGKLPKEEKTESLNCSHCGTIAELGTDFCEQCGHKL